MEAHAPYTDIPKRFLDSFLTPAQRKRFHEINQDRQMYLTRSIEMPPEDFEILRSVYDAQISYLNTRIKELLEILKYEDMLDNSLVIITSDHGDMIGEHSLMHHSYCLYEELIKVPLLLKLPGNEGNRKERYDLVSLVDLFPTILDCLGLDSRLADCKSQGISLLTQDSETHREYVFVECEKPKNEFTETYPDFDFSVYDRQLLAIRSRRHKFIWASDGRHEFYDLKKDPREEHNRIGEDTDTADRLREELLKWYGSFEKYDTTETQNQMDLDQEVKERLQALGYF
jgi:arylsulfatase A-like enzyme